jgi:hypothetical protein
LPSKQRFQVRVLVGLQKIRLTKNKNMKTLFLCVLICLGSVTIIGRENLNFSVNGELPTLSKQNLWCQIKESGIKFPEFVFAQAVLESGHFTSNLFKLNNNLFGMRIPTKRETVAVGRSKSGYAIYDHWTQSVNDYMLFQNYVINVRGYNTKEKYIGYLNRLYSESDGYVKKLNTIIKNHKSILDI